MVTVRSAFVIALLTALCLAESAQTQTAPEEVPPMRAVLIGHLYSLTVNEHSAEAKPFRAEEHLTLLVDEIRKIKPDAIFLLGDATYLSAADEWARLHKAFAAQDAPVHILPGNHDMYLGLDHYLESGGKNSRSVIFGSTKFILLGHESFRNNLPNPGLVDFIEQELKDHSEYGEVIILMHFLLKGHPFWEKEIVPILRGRVHRVFAGDLVSQHLQTQTDRKNDIRYIRSSFNFKGEGPAVFLELQQGEEEVRVIPHALPLDLSQPWYEENPESLNAKINARLSQMKSDFARLPRWLSGAAVLFAVVMILLSAAGLNSLVRKLKERISKKIAFKGA